MKITYDYEISYEDIFAKELSKHKKQSQGEKSEKWGGRKEIGEKVTTLLG